MEMEDSIFAIITGHDHVRSDSGRGEKRKTLRIPMSMRVKITVLRPQPRAGMVVVREISAQGIGLLGDVTLESKSEFIIEFPRPGQLPWLAKYQTVRCTRAPGGKQKLFFIGAFYLGMHENAPPPAKPKPAERPTAANEASELDRIRQAVLG